MIFKLMDINYGFNNTELYINFKNKLVEDYKNKLLFGRVLLSGNNSTLFGNGPEMLLALTGAFKLDSNDNISVLKKGQIRSTAFNNKAKLVCARSPHITMGNLYIAENNLENEIFDYFDLGNNIVCVNAINENLQQRLNGCDYDSDMMLITDEKLIVEAASKNNHQFKVPVCNIESVKNLLTDLYELDHKTSENKIGEIVNLSQKLNSIIWDELNNNENIDKINEVYHDVCKLAVLSGIEIDKAKRSFAIDSSAELRKIENKYKTFKRPTFFKDIDIKTSSKYESKVKEKDYEKYMTTMEYIYEIASKIDFRKEKQSNIDYVPISSMLNVESKPTSTDYENKAKIINVCNEYEKRLSALRMKLRKSDEDEKEIVYENINQTIVERNKKVEQYLKNKNVLYLVIKSLEKNKETDWNIYAPLLDHPMFIEILNGSKAKMSKVIEKEDGEFKIFKFSFTKKS